MRRAHRNQFTALLLLFLPACSEAGCRNFIQVSKLIEQNLAYNGQPVCAIGFIRIEFEGDQLTEGESGVRLSFFKARSSKEQIARDEKRIIEWHSLFQGECVYLSGHFSIEEAGRYSRWPARIDRIESINKAPKALCGSNNSFKADSQPLRGREQP